MFRSTNTTDEKRLTAAAANQSTYDGFRRIFQVQKYDALKKII